MWNKISNYRERFRKFWNEDGSYTFILVPDDGREFKRKTYEKEYLKMTYGENYMTMPKKIKIHGRMPALIKIHGDNLHEIFVESIEKMKKIPQSPYGASPL